MSRSVAWRRSVSDACNWHQTQALESTIYILRQTGPTGFLLKEEGERKNVKVFMGDPHTCTCPVFKKERDLCQHICWLLLKKFRLSVNDPLSWQLGLVEREINEILRGRVTAERPQHRQSQNISTTSQVINGRPVVEQREIAEEDVCPICQDELLAKKLPVTYCKFACGNSIHIKCMQVWAEHQQKSSPEGTIKCPMCREDFGPIEMLKTEMRNAGARPDPPPGVRMDRHLGVMCSNCSTAPIEGKCYRCVTCPTFHLCQRCFNFPIHTTHSFQFRQKRNQRWRAAPRTLGSALPDALVNDLMQREITENDYELLLQMERNEQLELSNLTEDDLQSIPLERVREGGQLLSIGAQCRVCLRGFSIGQTVRKLPCKHRFHQDCIDSWLLHSHPTCPIDGLQVNNRQSTNLTSERSQPTTQGATIGNNNQSSDNFGGLTLTAMGIPISASRTHSGGSSNSLMRDTRRARQTGSIGGQMVGSGLELLGVGVTAANCRGNGNVEPPENTSTVPGGRLLQHAALKRSRLTSRLLRNNTTPPSPSNRLPPLDVTATSPWGGSLSSAIGDVAEATRLNNQALSRISMDEQLTPAALVSLLGSETVLGGLDANAEADLGERGGRRLSLASRGSLHSNQSNDNSHSNDQAQRRQRNNVRKAQSAERDVRQCNTITNRKELQEMFLGNNPLTQPALTEGTAVNSRPPIASKPRTRLFRSVFSNQSSPSIQTTRPGAGNIYLEGNAFSTDNDPTDT